MQEPIARLILALTAAGVFLGQAGSSVFAAAMPQNEPPKLAEVRGRFLTAKGAPAPGVELRLTGESAGRLREERHGVPAEYEPPVATTDETGRFSMRFEPPQAFEFTLEVEAIGYLGKGWWWHRIQPGQVVDIGDVRLRPTGTVVGTLRFPDGRPVRGIWRVHAGPEQGTRPGKKTWPEVTADLDPQTGRFRLEGVPSGPAQLKAFSSIASWVPGPVVEVVPDEEVETEIVFRGKDPSRQIYVTLFSERIGYYVADFDPESIHLTGPGLDRWDAREIRGLGPTFAFEDVPPGSYTVEIDLPLLQRWTAVGVRPSTRVTAHLQGTAAVRLEVIDGRTGEPIEHYRLDVRPDPEVQFDYPCCLLKTGRPPPDGGLYEGLLPISQFLRVLVHDLEPREFAVPDLQPFETRELRAELFPPAQLAGVVFESGGRTPVPGARVRLERFFPERAEGQQTMEDAYGIWPYSNKIPSELRTDRAGRFQFGGVPVGTYSLRAEANPWLVGEYPEFRIPPGAGRLQLELSLPPSSSLRGRLLAPEGEDCSNLLLFARPSAPASSVDPDSLEREIDLKLAPDGSFSGELLPPGEVALVVSGAPRETREWRSNPPSTFELARIVLPPGETSEREVDLRFSWPGAIQVEVRRNGQPAEGYVVLATLASGRWNGQGSAVTDRDGVATIESVFPGEYQVLVRPLEGPWRALVPGTVSVESQETASCALEVDLVRGILCALDAATAGPLRNQALRIDAADSSFSFFVLTDEEGQGELELPRGSYVLRGGVEWSTEVPFEWAEPPVMVRL